ncbi:MAG: Rrf2 family transcriptional regulator [Candidatus Omnitrophica bacterium]|nr:Rrf2 family transcriptional regulator [Candidatus Omnitrophota bacterium]
MKFTTKTEYGLVCLIYMARHVSADMVTIKEIVKTERFSPAYIEKILQKLRSANIVVSHQGKQGGYALARPASEITLKEIIEALEGGATFDVKSRQSHGAGGKTARQAFGVFCEPVMREKIVCTHFSMCGLRPVWQKTKELLDHFYHSVTLEMIAKEEYQVKDLVTAR